MKTTKLFTAIIVSASLAFGATAQAGAKKHKHEEENLRASDVPAAVMKAAEKEAKGGQIVRWEKEGTNYEAVIAKNGKEWGFTFDANGKMMGKHDESNEHKEHAEKH